MEGLALLLQVLSRWALPTVFLLIPLYGYLKGVAVYDTFVEGAREGAGVAVRLLPYLVAMVAAIEIFRGSGAMDHLVGLIAPITDSLGIPREVLPLALIRPLSGSGSLGVLNQILRDTGADSLAGRMASAIMASTETTFYVLTVYLGAVGVRKSRHCLACSLLADLAGFLAAAYLVRLVFR